MTEKKPGVVAQVLEVKPTTFARGVPKAQHNGFYGIEETLLGMPIGTQITAIVTYKLSDDITKRGDGVRYPVIGIDHIEPLWDENEVLDAQALQLSAYTERTGKDELDFSAVEKVTEGGDED